MLTPENVALAKEVRDAEKLAEMKASFDAKLKQSMMMTFWPLGLTNDGAACQLTQPPCIAGEEKMTLDKVDILDF